jgi:hypothetical protein
METFFTAFYSVGCFTFMSKPSVYRQVICFYDSGINITFALGCLAIPSIL